MDASKALSAVDALVAGGFLTGWSVFRLVKFAALLAAGAGLVGAVTAPTRSARLQMLYGFGVSGFVGTWVAGWMLTRLSARSLGDPWILAGMAGSAVALHGAFLGAFARPDRARTLAPSLVFAGLLATVGWMVLRPGTVAPLAVVGGVGALVGAAVGAPWRAAPVVCDEADQAWVRTGFRWVARLEGASATLLILVGLPLRLATGLHLDGGTGLLGWTHGVLFLVYLQCASSTSRPLGWTPGTWAIALLAALIPGGTFAVERRLLDPAPRASGTLDR